MRLVLLGAPGVGKGTQADQLSVRFGRPKISTGEILREAVRNKTTLGLEAKACMDEGKLVPDSIVVGIVRDKLGEPACARGFFLDGFPRTVPQAEELGRMLEGRGSQLDRVVNVMVPREKVVKRLTGRRTCPKCQAVFHVDFAPPARAGRCDRCGGELVQRTDDKRGTVEARLKVYEEQTEPLIHYYRQKALLSDVDGSGPVEEVQRRFVEVLDAHRLT